jgi:amino acid transporter
LFGGLLVYLGQIVWPDYMSFPNIDTAFIDVTGRVGGPYLLQATAIMLVAANIGAGFTAQVGAARLLFGMGRENVLPKRIFGHLHPVHKTPDVNVIIVGILAFLGTLCMSYELTAEILNFGAFLGFMCVNLAAFWCFWIRGNGRSPAHVLTNLASPLLGFVFCAAIWWGLASPAKIAGSIWLLAGITLIGYRSDWFRKPLTLSESGYQE